MEFQNIQLRQDFNTWLEKNYAADLHDGIELHFYGKNEIEQKAYYVAFLDEKGYVITTPAREDDLKYMVVIFDKHERSYFVQQALFDNMQAAIGLGIEAAAKMLMERTQ